MGDDGDNRAPSGAVVRMVMNGSLVRLLTACAGIGPAAGGSESASETDRRLLSLAALDMARRPRHKARVSTPAKASLNAL